MIHIQFNYFRSSYATTGGLNPGRKYVSSPAIPITITFPKSGGSGVGTAFRSPASPAILGQFFNGGALTLAPGNCTFMDVNNGAHFVDLNATLQRPLNEIYISNQRTGSTELFFMNAAQLPWNPTTTFEDWADYM